MTRNRPKFGMIELIVVLGMIAILAGQLIPAVLKIRESVAASR